VNAATTESSDQGLSEMTGNSLRNNQFALMISTDDVLKTVAVAVTVVIFDFAAAVLLQPFILRHFM
jgi:hypothetical protein